MAQMTYEEFLALKSQFAPDAGFEPTIMPGAMFDFQRDLTGWAVRGGRRAIFADCGLGKTLMQLVWAANVAEHTGGRVLILAPLAVGAQSAAEGRKFGIACTHSRDGDLSRAERIVVTNYEKLHLFDPADFRGLVCDESSILKHFSGATQKAVTRFSCKLPYRLLCTATAAPNDYTELGTSAEALGEMGHSDMLTRFFVQDDAKRSRMNDVKLARAAKTGNYYQRLAYRAAQQISGWHMKAHAETHFWRWVASWARACRMPSDLGFSDGAFVLPPLEKRDHVVAPTAPRDGHLFVMDAFGLQEEREERHRTAQERCAMVADLANHSDPVVIWCHYNYEGDLLARLIPGAVEVSGATTDDAKEAAYAGFADGSVRVLITKPKIGAWGLNWQHCNHVITFASHSYEQYYQSIRRCWRFGQKRPVTVDVISTTGEVHVRENMERKAAAADLMFERLVRHMSDGVRIARATGGTDKVEVPEWIR